MDFLNIGGLCFLLFVLHCLNESLESFIQLIHSETLINSAVALFRTIFVGEIGETDNIVSTMYVINNTFLLTQLFNITLAIMMIFRKTHFCSR